ncbi:MAG: hypothetical protein KatS3mg111_3326 [Pirellulaceae bacterium]|nr:MAG: hypothetical protein KatS3mg111_3326 [Pirellulaceae bacterium]
MVVLLKKWSASNASPEGKRGETLPTPPPVQAAGGEVFRRFLDSGYDRLATTDQSGTSDTRTVEETPGAGGGA